MTPYDDGGEILSSHADEPAYDGSPVATARRRRAGMVLGSAALAVTLVAGLGTYAAGRRRSGAQPESVLPASTFALVKVDLDPGGGQQTAIRDLGRRFPAAGIGSVDDLRHKVVSSIAESSGLDYARDVKPWLGRRAALAAFSGPDGKPRSVIVLQVSDPEQARAELSKADTNTFVAERGGFLLAAGDQESLDLALAVPDDQSLADDDDFSADLDSLDGDQVVVAWIDNQPAVAAMVAELRNSDYPVDDSFLEPQIKSLEKAAHGRVVLGLHATSTYVELQGVATGDSGTPATGSPADLRRLPDTTVGAVYLRNPHGLTTAGLGGFGLPAQGFGWLGFGFGLLPSLLSEVGDEPELGHAPPVCPSDAPGDDETQYCIGLPGAMSPECQKQVEAWLEAGTDSPPPACFDLRTAGPRTPQGRALSAGLLGQDGYESDDLGELFWRLSEMVTPLVQQQLLPQLTGDTTVALGSLPAPGTDRAPDLALLADVADEGAATRFAESFEKTFGEQFSEQPVSEVNDGRLVLASDAAYRAQLGAGRLGDTELFRLAMGDLGDHVRLAGFANLERVRGAVPGYPEEMKPVSAIGISLRQQDGQGLLRVRVVAR